MKLFLGTLLFIALFSLFGLTTLHAQTVTPGPVTVTFNLYFSLYGIGPGVGNNLTPKNSSREVVITFKDQNNAPLTYPATVFYNPGTNNYTGTFTQSIPAGTYTIDARMNNTQKISAYKNLPLFGDYFNNIVGTLVSGDLNQDSRLDMADYNIFIGCFGVKLCNNKMLADLNDDGLVDEVDMNLFLRNFLRQTP